MILSQEFGTTHDANVPVEPESLQWEIKGSERRRQLRTIIMVAGPLLITFLVLFFLQSWIIDRSPTFAEGAASGIAIVVGLSLLFAFSYFMPVFGRAYRFGRDGCTVTKGKRTGRFLWTDFESFYRYGDPLWRYGNWPGGLERVEMHEVSRRIEGSIFYLKKKPANWLEKYLYKTFIVIYSRPDNSEAVCRFLETYLSRVRATLQAEMGLAFFSRFLFR